MFGDFQIIGHRGWPAKYPENTLLGFEKAINAGATMIEFDVQLTADNHLAIFHDENTKRLCKENINISSSVRDDIKHVKVKDNEIPFLDELFHKFKSDTNYYVELKTFPSTIEDQKIKLVFYTVNEIIKHGLRRNCTIVSFDIGLLKLCRRLGFNNLGVNYVKGPKPYNSKLSCIDHNSIKGEVSQPTFAWTVNDRRRMKTLINHGVDGIVTDHVDKLVSVYKSTELVSG